MLTKLKLTNFQTHENTTIEFDKITTIIGSNGAGKSSIVRSLDLLFNNYPRGTSYITHGAEECEVKAKLDNKTIRRVRGKVNEYYLDEKKFNAFGSEVPDDIKEFVNINELNIQKQLDSALWFHLSPLEISRKLNKIVNLDLIDGVLKDVASQLYSANSDIRYNDSQIKQAEEAVDKGKWIEEVEEKVVKLKQKQKLLEQKKQELRDIKELNRKITELLTKVKKVPSIDFQTLDNKLSELQSLRAEQNRMESAVQNWKRVEASVSAAGADCQKSEAEFNKLKQLECPLCGK